MNVDNINEGIITYIFMSDQTNPIKTRPKSDQTRQTRADRDQLNFSKLRSLMPTSNKTLLFFKNTLQFFCHMTFQPVRYRYRYQFGVPVPANAHLCSARLSVGWDRFSANPRLLNHNVEKARPFTCARNTKACSVRTICFTIAILLFCYLRQGRL